MISLPTTTPPTENKVTVAHFYWLPYCSTCQKAKQHLEAHGVEIQQIIDVKTQPVPEAQVRQLAEALGGPEALFSKRAIKYRALGLDKMTLGPEDLIRYMTEEYTFITRPVLVTSTGKVLAGFSVKQYDALLKAT
jgi:arsenate reductase